MAWSRAWVASVPVASGISITSCDFSTLRKWGSLRRSLGLLSSLAGLWVAPPRRNRKR